MRRFTLFLCCVLCIPAAFAVQPDLAITVQLEDASALVRAVEIQTPRIHMTAQGTDLVAQLLTHEKEVIAEKGMIVSLTTEGIAIDENGNVYGQEIPIQQKTVMITLPYSEQAHSVRLLWRGKTLEQPLAQYLCITDGVCAYPETVALCPLDCGVANTQCTSIADNICQQECTADPDCVSTDSVAQIQKTSQSTIPLWLVFPALGLILLIVAFFFLRAPKQGFYAVLTGFVLVIVLVAASLATVGIIATYSSVDAVGQEQSFLRSTVVHARQELFACHGASVLREEAIPRCTPTAPIQAVAIHKLPAVGCTEEQWLVGEESTGERFVYKAALEDDTGYRCFADVTLYVES